MNGKIEELLSGSIGGSADGSNSAIKINSSNASALILTGTCDTEGAAVQISGSGTGLTTCQNGQWSATVDASGAPDGPVQFTATITLSDGTTASTILSGTKKTTAPTVTITTSPAATIHSGNVTSYTYSGTCSEAGKTVTVSSGSFSDTTTCSGGTWTKSLNVSSLAEGTLSFNAKHTDDVGNTTTAYQNQLKDTVAPANGSTSFTGAPSGVNATTTLNVTVNGAGDADRYMYKVGLAASTDCSVITGYANETLIATPIAANISALADGSVKLCAITRDAYGNYQAPAQAASATWTKDANAPSISGITGPTPAVGNSSTNFVFTVTYSENVTVNTTAGNVTLGGAATAGCTRTIAQGAANTAVITVSNCSGNGTLNIASLAANTATDVGSNQATVYSTASSNATVDNTAPTISGITGPTPASGTSATNFVFTVTFSENVTVSTTATNATLSGTTTGCSKTIAQGAANTATVTVSGCTGNGTFLIDAMAAASAADAAGNSSTVYNTDSSSATVDNTAPTVTGISAPSPTVGKSSASFVYTVTFSENVTVSTTASNITLGGTATAGCGVAVAQGAANTATVTVSGCTGNGTLNIASVAAGTAVDATSTNSVLYSTASSNATVDNTAPTISSVTGPSPAAGKSSTSLVWTVTFSESVTIDTGTTSNVTIGGTATTGCAVTLATSTATTGTISITGCTGDGTLNISNLAAGLAADAAGNALVPWVTGSSNGTIDNTAPTISSISAPTPSVGKSSTSFVYTVTFSENVTVSTTATNATLGGTDTAGCGKTIAQGAANTATVTITGCTGNGTILIDAMASASGVDAAGNNSTAYTTDSSSATVDNTAPTISGITGPAITVGKSSTNFVWTVTFSSDVTVSTTSTNATLGGTDTAGCGATIAQGASNTATVTVTGCTGNGTVLIDAMAAASGVDAAGNNSTAYTTDSSNATVDNTAPTISSISAPSPTAGKSDTNIVFTVTFSENVTVSTTSTNATLGGTATAGCGATIAQGAANTATVTVTGCTGNGTLFIDSMAAASAADAASNSSTVYNTDSSNATIDNTAPTVSSISAPLPTSGGSSTSFVFTVTYSENVSVVNNTANVTLGGTTTGCGKAMAQGAANTIAITINGCTGVGTMNVASLAAGTATDVAGNSATSYSTASSDATLLQTTLDPYFYANTLLMHFDGANNDNGFYDYANNIAVTRYGNASTVPVAKVAGGSSAYFDGTGDYITVADNSAYDLGSSNFTIEFWAYKTASKGNSAAFYKGGSATSNASYTMSIYDTSISYTFSSVGTSWDIAGATASTGVALNQWMHIALVRNGTAVTLYIDGVSRATSTLSASLYDSSDPLYIAGSNFSGGGNEVFPGYISDFRIVKSAVYTGAFTPPTTPLTAIANTGIYLPFSSMIDKSGWQNATQVSGAARVSTTQSKFGGSSLYLDGSSYLVMPDSDSWAFGSGDFTVEAWYYPTNSNAQQFIVGQWSGSTGGTSLSWLLLTSNDSNRYLRFLTSSTGGNVVFDLVSSSSLSLNAWNHVAIVRKGNNFQLYLNGTAATGGSTTNSVVLYDTTNVLTVGAISVGTSNSTGYIDDLRITKGVARYTGNFTAPTAAFGDAQSLPLIVSTYGEYRLKFSSSSVNVKAWGAGGGRTQDSTGTGYGGAGGFAKGTLAITSGQAYGFIVGQAGSGVLNTGTNPGVASGGGRSAFRLGTDDLLTAGGGGAGGSSYSTATGGAGGGTTASAGGGATPGGAGGSSSGGAAGAGGYSAAGSLYTGGHGGGTMTHHTVANATIGGGGKGVSDNSAASGAGGGGGYYGGGGATNQSGGGGAGGGSSYLGSATSASTTAGSGAVPGNNTDIDLISGASVGATLAGGYGGNGQIIFYDSAYAVKSITPTFGMTAGGSYLYISGANFDSTAAVTVGGTTCTSPTYSNVTLRCTIPAKTAGTYDVVVSQTGQSNVTFSNAFTYYADSMLMHMDGSNGSTSFPDTAGTMTMSASGATVSTSVVKFGTGSASFNGSSYIQSTGGSITLGTGDYTIEMWVYWTGGLGSNAQRGFFQMGGVGTSYPAPLFYQYGGTDAIAFVTAGSVSINSGVVPTTGSWYHVAVVRSGTTATLYVNGTSRGSATDSNNYGAMTVGIGAYYSSGYAHIGYVDEVSIVKAARYNGNFTPPTSPY